MLKKGTMRALDQQSTYFNFESIGDLCKLRGQFQAGSPFPYIVFDRFLDLNKAGMLHDGFPAVNSKVWLKYFHINERKYGCNNLNDLPGMFAEFFKELESKEFIRLIENITGIDGLVADPDLIGGGLHQALNRGYLNVHRDFSFHPFYPNLKRRLNLIIYLNKDWRSEYFGDLEFWSHDMSKPEVSIFPGFNRAVLFALDSASYHGFPKRLHLPPGISRKSIAIYYYTNEDRKFSRSATSYQCLPKDNMCKRSLVKIENLLLSFYMNLKRYFKFTDKIYSKLVGCFFSAR